MNVKISWKEKLQFTGTNESNQIVTLMDSTEPAFGGENKGASPKQLFLQAIAGCSAIDIVAILNKMRAVMPASFMVEVEGDVPEEHPKVFTRIHLTYRAEGETDKGKFIKAVNLSQEKYCGLSIMVKKITDFSYDIVLNNEKIYSGK